jgi:hypothetical protein
MTRTCTARKNSYGLERYFHIPGCAISSRLYVGYLYPQGTREDLLNGGNQDCTPRVGWPQIYDHAGVGGLSYSAQKLADAESDDNN